MDQNEGSGWSQARFASAQRLNIVGEDACLWPQLDRAASGLGMAISRQSMADFLDDDRSLPADISWVTLNSDPGADILEEIAARCDFAAPSLVLQLSGTALDPAWARFGDVDGTVLTIDPNESECAAALAQAMRTTNPHFANTVDVGRDRQIDQLQEEVQRIARMLARLAMDDAQNGAFFAPDGAREPASPFIEDNVRAATSGYRGQSPQAVVSPRDVRKHIRQRRLREEFFPADLFADPAWDMLLDLYASKLDRARVSVSSLCIAAAVPATTALRWIKTLCETGIFQREADHHDGRRIFVALSDQTTDAMHRYFARLQEV